MKNTTVAERRAEKRDRILQAAARIFASNGFYHAKISQIARAAGVADGTIYLYFKNKDEILITVFEESVGRIIQDFREKLLLLDSPVKKLQKFAHLHLEMVETQPDIAAMVQLELRQSNKFIKEYAGTSIADYLNLINEILEEGQEKNIFRKDIQLSIAKRVLFGALDEFSTVLILAKNKKFDLEESANQIAEIFLSGMKIKNNNLK
ncbi:MAG: TetR/AcrR family transcriptional regulator [Deferribacteres bacterium]|nr:TetR/AcrR family transcriptional regulator [candidate division KSB1 bacterium]MCB9502315.1 TetR/AcrR family transcriptional regulator [Deferribacteres bacterium]